MKSYVRMPNGIIYHCDSDEIVNDSIKFDNNSVLLLWDIITDGELIEIIQTRGTPKYIVSESYSFLHIPGLDTFCAAKWIESEVNRCSPKMKSIDQLNTTHSASFCVNKKQTNRYLLIKLCEIFDIECNYTWSGIGKTFDLSAIINENRKINDETINFYFSEILSPLKTNCNWLGKGTLNNNFAVLDYGMNYESWNNGLCNIIGSSAIHLVGESIVDNADACHFTEKTMYAIQGLTFPIWVGGKNQATEWKKYGFDVFDDIIDHSYQNYDTLLERCFYAFYLNLELLQDKNKVAQLRESNINRLRKNQELLVRETFKIRHNTIVASWPEDLQQAIVPLFKKYTIE